MRENEWSSRTTATYSHATHVVELEEELPREFLERADVRLNLSDRCVAHAQHQHIQYDKYPNFASGHKALALRIGTHSLRES